MSSLVLIGVDMEHVNSIFARLGNKGNTNDAMKKALKMTAEQARKRLEKKAQDSYTVKNADFKKAMHIRTTSGNKPAAIIRSEGEPLPLENFKTSKAGGRVRAQVIKAGRLKELNRGGIKAFINNIADKDQVRKRKTSKGAAGSKVRHIAVAQREGCKRLHINEKFSNSIPVMLGSQKHVYGAVEPHIVTDLQVNLRYFIEKALGE